MEAIPASISTVMLVLIGIVEFLSVAFMLLVIYNVLTMMRSRTIFFSAVAGGKPRGVFLWTGILLTIYVVVLLLVIVSLDLLYIFQPHLL